LHLLPMISRCKEPGCSTIGMGTFCIAHTPKPNRVFLRGRPWPPPDRRSTSTLSGPLAPALGSLTPAPDPH